VRSDQVLWGPRGRQEFSGKVMRKQRPASFLANAAGAQFWEFKGFFPENAVILSYYWYLSRSLCPRSDLMRRKANFNGR